MQPDPSTDCGDTSPDSQDRIEEFLARHGGAGEAPRRSDKDSPGDQGWSEVYAADGYTLRCEWSQMGSRKEMKYFELAPRSGAGGKRQFPIGALFAFVIVGFFIGCHHPKSPQATASDVEAAQKEARQEIEQARVEASKDVKSATKIMGPESKNVVAAKVTGSYDVAMARADGEHKVATEKCMTMETPSAQQSCKAEADLAYDSAAATAKATRLSRQQ